MVDETGLWNLDQRVNQVEQQMRSNLDEVKRSISQSFKKMKAVGDLANQDIDDTDQKIDPIFNQILDLLKLQTENICEIDQKIDHKFDQIFDVLKRQKTGNNKSVAAEGSFQNATKSNQEVINNGQSYGPRALEIKFPVFNGEDPIGWLYKCSAYFENYHIPEIHKVGIASYHFEGKAEIWFRRWEKMKREICWEDFADALCERFEEKMNDIVEEFSKLKQEEGSVKNYMEKFEELMNLMSKKFPELTEQFFVSSFLSRLNEEIKLTVKMFDPKSLMEAYRLARLQERSVEAMLEKFKSEIY